MKALKYVLPLVLAVLVSGVIAGEKVQDKLSGTVAEKAKDAKEGIAATLKVKNGDKETVVNLLATGKVADQLVKDIGKTVEVVGTKVDDTNFTVTEVKVEKEKSNKKGGKKTQ